ncbi:MAG: hypothetical protein WCT05_00185 [Lentisphaeria bacterium]
MNSNENAIPQILPKSSLFTDQRLLHVRHNEYAWCAVPPVSMAEWEKRKAFTIEQVQLAAGLLPEIPALPLKAEVWGHTPYEGTIIAKVCMETLPGLKLTGNLYLPGSLQSKAPAILCPHGHWQEGRIHHDERGSVPMRCLMLARLGFIVFSYDMIGYNDNNELLHRWPKELSDPSALHGVSAFGLQTWNSLRAVDFLCSLPEVDADRLGCTGTSGGASQTWTLALLDERIKVIVPVCMLSSHFQGGCHCEEGPLLRLNGVTSFDIVSALAPRPLLLPSVTRDWTNLQPRYEFPALQKVYQLFGAQKRISNFHCDAPHNYNQYTRERVYAWFTHWLLNQALRERIPEDNVSPPPLELLLHSASPVAASIPSCRQALQKLQSHYCSTALHSKDSGISFAAWQKTRRLQVSKILNNDLTLANVAVRVTTPQWNFRTAKAGGYLISRRETGDIISGIWVNQADSNAKLPTFLIVADQHKNAFFPGGNHAAILDTIVGRKCNALLIELLGTGETAPMLDKSPRDENDPTFYAFNPSLFSLRVQDILTSLTVLQENGIDNLALVAVGEASRAAICALTLAPQQVSAFLDLDKVTDTPENWGSRLSFQPMILKIGGLKGCLMMAAERQITLCKPAPDIAQAAEYASQAAAKNCRLCISNESLIITLGRFLGNP